MASRLTPKHTQAQQPEQTDKPFLHFFNLNSRFRFYFYKEIDWFIAADKAYKEHKVKGTAAFD